MKKNYKMTPSEYEKKEEEMNEIAAKLSAFRFGRPFPDKLGRMRKIKSLDVPKEKARFDTLRNELAGVDVPGDKFYFRNEVVYNLYMNRGNKEPVTSDELFDIINTLLGHTLDVARVHGSSSDYRPDGMGN